MAIAIATPPLVASKYSLKLEGPRQPAVRAIKSAVQLGNRPSSKAGRHPSGRQSTVSRRPISRTQSSANPAPSIAPIRLTTLWLKRGNFTQWFVPAICFINMRCWLNTQAF
ncbi:hypothetical protein PAAG_08763 [Paracoccidioides lutzii Pb01]|uniref:Uncharacterized protein n=1 Tax=Paracoccidioides lutzii (strain ATCC MYA-826 / Pb01) TaxID=502779 RepID=C1HDC2_PARBA|nr:hypothetical protein PAAG_08763 [Paracoccidioides lutzii Pb01]EEH39494.2 hypothetical protein PAAG_08763 [Paracoccidioides lutzii Pb01]